MKDVIGKVEEKQFIKYLHDDVIPSGSTFGDHAHNGSDPFEEWYFCLSGEGVMVQDGKDYAMKPGDISVCYNGGTHGIKNTGKEGFFTEICFLRRKLPPCSQALIRHKPFVVPPLYLFRFSLTSSCFPGGMLRQRA